MQYVHVTLAMLHVPRLFWEIVFEDEVIAANLSCGTCAHTLCSACHHQCCYSTQYLIGAVHMVALALPSPDASN